MRRAGGLEIGEQIAECAALRRAAARTGDHVPVIDRADLAGAAGARIGEDTVNPGNAASDTGWPDVAGSPMSGIASLSRCRAPPSSSGAGIFDQSTLCSSGWLLVMRASLCEPR